MSKRDKIDELPIYKKAELLFQLVESLVGILPEEDDYLEASKDFMLSDAMILPAKIAGAEAGNLYSIKMQNAAIIREHAMSLYVQVGSLRFHENFSDVEYALLIRRELEEFRDLFVQWVAGFDQSDHIWDEWGLFNPKGTLPPSLLDDLAEGLFNFDDVFDDFDEDLDDEFEDDEE